MYSRKPNKIEGIFRTPGVWEYLGSQEATWLLGLNRGMLWRYAFL